MRFGVFRGRRRPRTADSLSMSRSRPATALLVIVLAAAMAPLARAEQIVETDDDGNVILKYSVDDDGLSHGAYHEFFPGGKRTKQRTMFKHGVRHGDMVTYHPNGKLRVKTRYKDGKPDGPFVERDDDGRDTYRANYAAGLRDGEFVRLKEGRVVETQVWDEDMIVSINGAVVHPRTRDEIAREIEDAFSTNDPLEKVEGDEKAKARGESLRRLKAFRAVVGVPWREMRLDARMNAHGDAGAALCERIGRLDHTPANPGMPEEKYKFGYTGTSNSNLYVGPPETPMISSVRAYMDDSDPSNIAKVGHRRWCINPRMLKTGFGSSGRYSAMWSMDQSNRTVSGHDTVSYPPGGYAPTEYFAATYAWSVGFRARDFAAPGSGGVKIEVVAVDEEYQATGEPLGLEAVVVAKGGTGDRFCVIFRPLGLDVSDGARYRATIEGVTRGGDPYTHRYFVHFFDLL